MIDHAHLYRVVMTDMKGIGYASYNDYNKALRLVAALNRIHKKTFIILTKE